jgi:hypothetical protein
MRIRYLRTAGAAIGLTLLLTAQSSMAASPGYPNIGIAHPTYASQQAKRQAASSYRAASRIYSQPVQSRRSFSYQPVVVDAFKAGEQVKIAGDGVKLMRGHDTIATLNQGQEITVLKVQGRWLGTSIEIGGETKSGWVAVGSVIGVCGSPAPVPKP